MCRLPTLQHTQLPLLAWLVTPRLLIWPGRLRTIWHLGRYDLHHGFIDVSDQFLTSALASFKRVLSMHIILFAMSWIITLLYLVLVYKPFLRHGDGEVKSIAKMLSQMPPDMDVESLVEQVLLINASPATTGADPCSLIVLAHSAGSWCTGKQVA
jgi:hypothetical protein